MTSQNESGDGSGTQMSKPTEQIGPSDVEGLVEEVARLIEPYAFRTAKEWADHFIATGERDATFARLSGSTTVERLESNRQTARSKARDILNLPALRALAAERDASDQRLLMEIEYSSALQSRLLRATESSSGAESAAQGTTALRPEGPNSAGWCDLFELYECELVDIADVIDERLAGRTGSAVFRIAHSAGHWACLSAFIRGALQLIAGAADGEAVVPRHTLSATDEQKPSRSKTGEAE